MTRKKVKLAFITNDAARKATFKKRKKGLMKKVHELSTLCDIEACAIVYSPFDREPEVWPSALGVQRTIAAFKSKSEIEQSKKMMNQESFLRQRISKAEEQLKKTRRENREKKIERAMYRALMGEGIQNLSLVDLNELGWMVDKNIKKIDERLNSIEEDGSNIRVGGSNEVMMMSRDNFFDPSDNSMQNQQWIMELLQMNESMSFGKPKVEELQSYDFSYFGNFMFP